MVKNLTVCSKSPTISKRQVHKLVSSLMFEFNINISFLSINFINSNEIRKVNKTYLGHDYETDVVTFNYSKSKNNLDGEILISIDEAKTNAKKYKVSFAEEIKRLVIHGILHLLNFDDSEVKSKKIMKKQENKLINKFNFTLLVGK